MNLVDSCQWFFLWLGSNLGSFGIQAISKWRFSKSDTKWCWKFTHQNLVPAFWEKSWKFFKSLAPSLHPQTKNLWLTQVQQWTEFRSILRVDIKVDWSHKTGKWPTQVHMKWINGYGFPQATNSPVLWCRFDCVCKPYLGWIFVCTCKVPHFLSRVLGFRIFRWSIELRSRIWLSKWNVIVREFWLSMWKWWFAFHNESQRKYLILSFLHRLKSTNFPSKYLYRQFSQTAF